MPESSNVYTGKSAENYAAPLLILGCVIFGLGSLIVKFVPVGAYAARQVRRAFAGLRHHLCGAGLEDASLQQGHSAPAVAAPHRAPQSIARVVLRPRRKTSGRRLRAQTPVLA